MSCQVVATKDRRSMCGILGHHRAIEADLVRSRAALTTMLHRGPDQWGEWYNNEIYIGHRRLSILDLSENGRQPMLDEDRNLVLTVNGEIYNFLELRSELEKDWEFYSESDSEVLLYGYKAWGIQRLMERIDGMYAFSLLDLKQNKIFLVRDRPGIKPLFLYREGKKFAWASELKAIVDLVGKDNLTIDRTSIYDFFTYKYVPTPKTLYLEIQKIPPGHYIELDLASGDVTTHCYWTLVVKEKATILKQAEEDLRNLILYNVEAQLMSDVPVGFFLSGGMDSSVIVSEASKLSNNINAYSIGFDVTEHDETSFAQQVADYFDVNHQVKILDNQKAMELLEKVMDLFDEPFGDTSALPTYLVSKLAREESTVVLTGDGGDELLGGYNWYFELQKHLRRRKILPKSVLRVLKKIRFAFNLPRRLGGFLDELLLEPLELYARLLGGLIKSEKTDMAQKLGISADYDDYWYFRKYFRPEFPLLTALQYLDFHTYLPDDILTKVDRTTMAVSLEARVPYLSRDLIEFCFSLPEEIRFAQDSLKGLMRSAYGKILPKDIVVRRKKGFSIPDRNWKGPFGIRQGFVVLSKPPYLLRKKTLSSN